MSDELTKSDQWLIDDLVKGLPEREAKIISGGQLIDAQECAERLGVTYQTLLRAVKCGNIPAVMVQSSYRFHWPTVVATQNEL